MGKCFSDLWEKRCQCGSKTVVYAVGWFGAIYRSVAILALAITIAPLPGDDNYVTFYAILLAYGFISLAANFLLIVGINKSYRHYLLPYLGIYGIEILVGLICIIGGIVIFIRMELSSVLAYFIPCGIIALGVYTYLWSLLVRLYWDLKGASEDDTSIQIRTHFCRYFRCSCSCFKSDSLDIVTYQ